MELQSDNIYHVYNQGNNRQAIFEGYNDYLMFLKKVRQFVKPHCDILAYCLMPNHFHFLLNVTEKSTELVEQGNIEVTRLSNSFRLLLSQYALDFNKKHDRSGSLFRQKTKSKLMVDSNQAFICFQYIHQNPWKAGLVGKMEDWEFSSFRDYSLMRNGSLCNKEIAFNLINVNEKTFVEDSYGVAIHEESRKALFN
ncbi:transposase [Roseivirga seohaensis subsp. aquiponti]|uniref:Transposase n=1 Tax=Roseivirga seohaensis subsp. aquiponti TaxID=1566026 RepID=A0A0L8AHE3_9BACT|nr:transposase [Roseivirga seohaensis]KOF01540.1 transposase [Roseivirga seohaensis subsp. aquiponti]